MANGAEEEEDMGGGLRHLLSRKRLIPPRFWGEEQGNADSRAGMKCYQEEKAESRGYKKTGKDLWKE